MEWAFRFPATLRAASVLFLGLLLAPAVSAVPPGTVWWHDHPSRALQSLIGGQAAATEVVPAALALAVAKEASDFNHRVLSATGAIGVMQISPHVAAREFGVSADELWDPVTNVRVGVHYLSRLYWRYDGDWELALSHYRGGPLPWEAGRYRAHDFTRAYVDRVTRWWRRYHWDPPEQMRVHRGQDEPRFGQPFRIYPLPRLTDEAPWRARRQSPWIAVTGGGRFQ